MFQGIRQIAALAMKTRKFWLLPVILFIIIVALIIVAAEVSPVPIFIYPLV